MVLSERQKDILGKTIFEYINRAEPVSSGWLERRYDMEVSPATIRLELSYLTEEWYLEQPHTSSGRVPTDRGYRLFVDEGLEKYADEEGMEAEADFSDLALAYYQNILWKEGWESVLRAPEFAQNEVLVNFTKFLLDVEQNIRGAKMDKAVEIYIGKENPFSRVGDFSMIMCECDFARGQNGFVAIVGPKRMPYHRNIGLMHSFADLWKKR